jgi:amino acid adenylation domain-containing protein
MSLRELYRSLSTLSPEQRALFARRLEQTGWGRQAIEILPRPEGFSPIPASLMQQRLWLMDQLEPGHPFYNLPLLCFQFTGPLRVDVLERAFQEIERRHEGLRTRFAVHEGSPIQVIEPYVPRPLALIDVSALPDDTDAAGETLRWRAAWGIAMNEARRPFDLTRTPLWRVHAVRLAPGDHLMMICMHHIISDAWSLGVFYREVMALYSAFLNGRPSPLPEPSIQYADFALWQRQRLQGELLDEELRFWKAHLDGAPDVIELPLDRPRPATRGYKGKRLWVTIPPGLPEALSGISLDSRTSLYMVLLAAFKALLHRYSGQSDLVLGAPVAGRNNAGTEGLIGFFVNTVVFRTPLGGDPTFEELIGRVRGIVLDVYEHSELPFDRLVEELQPRRDSSYDPVYQVVFSLQNTAIPDLELEGTETLQHGVDNGTSQTDMVFFAGMDGGKLGLIQIEYNTEIFDDTTMLRLEHHLLSLLSAGAADTRLRLSELPLLAEPERHQLLREWNDSRAAAPEALTVDRWFERHAAARPDHLAISAEGISWTYGELDARANRLAHHLLRLGAMPEDRIGVCLERSPDLVAAFLGVLKAGATYLPLDPAHPEKRLAGSIEDAGVSLVVTSEAWAPFFAGMAVFPILVDAEAAAFSGLDAEPSDAPERFTGPRNLAYLLYTSGSTGLPKGVEVEHASLLNLVSWGHRAVTDGVSPDDRFTFTASLAFDVSVWEMWLALTAGGSLHLLPADYLTSPPELVQWLDRERITVAFLVTPLGRRVLEEPLPESLALRSLFVGGDRCPEPPAGLPFEVINLYGPTEATVATTAGEVFPEDRVTIGRPLANTQVYLTDRHRALVPTGGFGEILLGGGALARGYHGRPDLTADRFIPDPFSGEAGGRLYRTGDLARFVHDGRIDFLGRVDQQVKVRGFRIELGEVEATLERHPAVRECAVVLREIVPGEMGMAAYYSLSSPTEVAELRAYLKESLPEYMIPSVLFLLEALPLTPTGKLDRKALPEPGRDDFGGERPYVAPRTPMEESLAALWQELLGLERVGAEDDFFFLGGHSLLAVRLISRLRERHAVNITTRLVFQSSTLAAMAKSLEDLTATGQRTEEPALVALPRPGRRPRNIAGSAGTPS